MRWIQSIAHEQSGRFLRVCEGHLSGVASVQKSQSDAFIHFPFLQGLQLAAYSKFHHGFSQFIFRAVMTGGSISSMFHGQGYGDVDFFFICELNSNYKPPPHLFEMLHQAACDAGVTRPEEVLNAWHVLESKGLHSNNNLNDLDGDWIAANLP